MNRQDLIKLLVCPRCKGSLTEQKNGLACLSCRLVYPVRNQIPVMLVDQALPMEEDETNSGESSCASS